MRKAPFAIVSLALLTFASHASASILTYTYRGTVSFGTDYTGVFGTANTDLAGKMFEVVERFDTTKARFIGGNGSTFSYQMGGSNYSASTLSAKATISIGGSAPREIQGDYKDSTQNNTQGGTPSNTTSVAGYHSFIDTHGANHFYDESLQFSAYAPSITYDYTQPFSLTTSTGAFSGSYSLSAFTGSYPNFTTFDSASANFQPTSLTVTNTMSAVPLPSSLPMLGCALLALAGVGLTARRNVRSVG